MLYKQIQYCQWFCAIITTKQNKEEKKKNTYEEQMNQNRDFSP